MREAIVTVLFFIMIGTSLALSIYGHLPERPATPRRFDVAAARRESHALGLPFPESDGTLSLPPEPKSAVAKTQVYVLAQFGVTSEEALNGAAHLRAALLTCSACNGSGMVDNFVMLDSGRIRHAVKIRCPHYPAKS